MKDVKLEVNPASVGWWLACDFPIEPTFFHSGARAEKVARDLALRLCSVGHEVRLVIADRTEQVIATHRYFA